MPSPRTKNCPVCGEEIPEDAETCPRCGANLELLELEGGVDESDMPLAPLESFLDAIGDAEDVDPEKILEEMRKLIQMSEENNQEKSGIVEIAETPGSIAEEDVVENETSEEVAEEEIEYVCPICEKPVGPEDKICPHCGAIFVETDEEMEEVLEEQLAEAKRLIKSMREKGIDVSDVTPYLKNANIARRKGDVEAALENAIECVIRAKEKFQTPSNSS